MEMQTNSISSDVYNFTEEPIIPDTVDDKKENEQNVFRPRKRICNKDLHKKNIAKKKVECGIEHNTAKGIRRAKVFRIQTICKCSKGCPLKIDTLRQKEIFDAFYLKSDWSQKTYFLRQSVKTSLIKKKKNHLFPIMPAKNRTTNFSFCLLNSDGLSVDVCRDFFIACLQISPSRVYNAVNNAIKNPTAIENRGRAEPKNKTSIDRINDVKQFIDQIPAYESHYCREKTDKKYLSHTLNQNILYREYVRVTQFRDKKPVPQSVFRKIFNTEYNLSFKKRHTDTCKTCDELNVRFKNRVVIDKTLVETEKKNHMELVDQTNTAFRNDVQKSSASDGESVVLTFDLQKTLETPSISTSIAFYKRKMWTYNLCIYNEIEKKGYMYIWSENIASRGGQEVASCLLKHLKSQIPENTKHVILWSDSCGGQNRNIKVTLLLKKFLSESQLDVIEQKFFVSGHSYNSCDRCFSLIEKHKRFVGDIYSTDDWIQMIGDSKKKEPKFQVTKMMPMDFVPSGLLEKLIVNRKKDVKNNKINWFGFRVIRYSRNDLFRFIAVQNGVPKLVNLQKKGVDETTFITAELNTLYPEGKSTNELKHKDLIELTKYIPSKYHKFYNELKSSKDSIDFGMASDYEDDDVVCIDDS